MTNFDKRYMDTKYYVCCHVQSLHTCTIYDIRFMKSKCNGAMELCIQSIEGMVGNRVILLELLM